MYGRTGELAKLNQVRNDPTRSDFARREADKAHKKIVEQMKDKPLMAMRERLIRAARAGDLAEQHRIAQQMKAHTGEDRETGL